MSLHAFEFINDLLDPDPETRLGTKGVEEIKNHVFFKKVGKNYLCGRFVNFC